MLDSSAALFGSPNRTRVLVAIRLLGETWASELAAMLGLRLFSVQTILASLERDSVIVTRTLGRTRQVTLNPRYFASSELEALLWKLGQNDTALQRALASHRRRPRRTGKTLG